MNNSVEQKADEHADNNRGLICEVNAYKAGYNADKWIDINVEKPELKDEDYIVLCFWPDGCMQLMGVKQLHCHYGLATHWQPLPEVPK